MKLSFYLLLAALSVSSLQASATVTVNLKSDRSCTMSNGIITLSIDGKGLAKTMTHTANGSSNILASNGIYFDYTSDKNRNLAAASAKVVRQTDDYAEVVYTSAANSALPTYGHGYILREGESAVYTYVIVHGNTKSGDTALGGVGPVKETRVCTRLASTFLDGYVDEVMQGTIPSNSEMAVAEKTENTVQDATYKLADGSVYTKYNWAQFIDRDEFHGLMNGKVGVWNIPVSYEWINGGPMRQELTVHATSKSPITIQMLQGEHLGASSTTYNDDDHQIFGPFLIYINSGTTRDEMIADARKKAREVKAEWPFQWFENEYYPTDRSTVSGRIRMVRGESADGIKVVLAAPGGNLLRQGGNYIYWATTDEEGNFSIPAVRKGDYSLYAYATKGIVTDELCKDDISVESTEEYLGTIDWETTSLSDHLWHIGESDRLADGFNCSDKPRAYEAWQWQPATVTYTVGTSDWSKDWYNAQSKNGTWTVKFNLDKQYSGNAVLTLSLAGVSNSPKLVVAVNGTNYFNQKLDDDGSVRRSATLAGRHRLHTIKFPASKLKTGSNSVTLTASNMKDKSAILYDFIKLEAGDALRSDIENVIADGATMTDVYTLTGILHGSYPTGSVIDLPAGIYILRSGSASRKVLLPVAGPCQL